MKNITQEVTNKVNQIIENHDLDGLIISDIYNIQYATGVKVPCAHAQTDMRIFAFIGRNSTPIIIVPKCWENLANQTKYDAKVISYSIENDQIAKAAQELFKQCSSAKRLGSDDDIAPLKIGRLIKSGIAEMDAEYISCADDLMKARSTKTETEIKHLKSIAMKTDHALNGYFHHLIADRSKSSMSVSENLRIHSLERDIDLEGYNACSRGVIGNNISNIWAYAPKFGFAASDFTQVGDPIIADAMNNENGYWSNSTRIAIMSEEMSTDQEDAYGQLVALRELICSALKIGRKCSEVYKDIVSQAADLNIPIIDGHSLGFCVGVSPMEGPFLSSGDQTTVDQNMVFVLDGLIQHKALKYRSRDTVWLRVDSAQIINCYKDWREPYFALNTI